MKIYLATDHGGFELKENIKKYLKDKSLPAGRQGYEVEDCGAYDLNPIDDYPDFISKVGEKISEDPKSFGIIFGKSGEGECIVANKFKNVRAVVAFSKENVSLTRVDNDANILCIGSQFISYDLAKEMIDIFLNTEFSNEDRHIRRINKIKQIESK